MAALRRFYSFRKAKQAVMLSFPVVSFGIIGSVNAESEKKLVNPRDLDIYAVPTTASATKVEASPSRLQLEVSKVRKLVWRATDQVVDAYTRTEDAIITTKKDLEDFYVAAQADPVLLLKPSVISAGILMGLILPVKGSKKIVRGGFATVFGLSCAAICYPKHAVRVSVVAYEKAAALTSSLVNVLSTTGKETSETRAEVSEQSAPEATAALAESIVEDKETEETLEMEGAAATEEVQAVAPEIPVTPAEELSSEANPVTTPVENQDNEVVESVIAQDDIKESKKDFGQSDPEDSDMYTTR